LKAPAIVLAALLCASGCQAAAVDGTPVPVFEVEGSDTFVRRVSAEGTLRAVEATPLTAPPDAQRPMKIAWVAPDGSEVAEGEVVVKFDSTEMERELADSEDDVTASKRKIAKEAGSGKINRRKRDVTADLADVEAGVAKEFESDDYEILSRNEIVESTIDVELADAKARHARRVKQIEKAVSSRQLDLLGIEKQQSTRKVEQAEDGLARLQVKAPHAGVLVLSRNWRGETVRVGDTVWRGQKLAELPLVAVMEAEMYVLEADAGDLAEGLPAELVVEAHPGVVHEAKVKRIDTLAQPRHPDVPVHYFGLTLEIPTTDPKAMRVGQRVRATIRVEVPDVIVVPRQAVFDDEGKTFVYREAGGGEFEKVEVELGPASAGRVVIASGLESGERVALRDPTKAAAELLGGGSEGEKAEKAPAGPGGGG
jgi:RND family efflux transporter MFP subunit